MRQYASGGFEGTGNPAVTRVRHVLRDHFRTHGLLDDIIPTMGRLLAAGEKGGEPPEELGGTREEQTDAWDFPWYRTTPGGEVVADVGESEPKVVQSTSQSRRGARPADSEEKDEGEEWADSVFGPLDTPWKDQSPDSESEEEA